MVPQQVVYQPQPIQYVQQPLQYTPQPIQYRPVQYAPQHQYQPQQPIQYQPQQPIQYQPQAVQYVPAVQEFIPIKKTNEPETLPEPEIRKHKIVAEQMKPEQFESEEIDSELEEKYTSAKDEQLIATVLRTAPSRAVLLSARGANGRDLLKNRLPSNYTTIRADLLIRDTFSCDRKIYGYYADVDNDCQIFHICLPYKTLPYPTLKKGETPPPDVTYQFSFICPKWTIFAQDTLTCAWATEAIPCARAAALTDVINGRFFKDVKKTKSTPEEYTDMNALRTDMDKGYQQNALNCWIAALLYLVTLCVSAQQFWMNNRSTYSV